MTYLTHTIGLPYAIREAGLVFGIILLVSLCAVTDWTIRLIVVNAKLSGRNSYIGVMDQAFGPAGRAAISFFQFAFAFGGMYLCLYSMLSRSCQSLQECVLSVSSLVRSAPWTLRGPRSPSLSVFIRRHNTTRNKSRLPRHTKHDLLINIRQSLLHRLFMYSLRFIPLISQPRHIKTC